MEVGNARKTIIASDYPMDKVILLKSGSYNLTGNTPEQIHTVPHGLPFTPLCSGNWSLTPDFAVQFGFGSGVFASYAPPYPFIQIANVYADSTNIYISADNYVAPTVTIYYRVYGFQPYDSNASLPAIAATGENFVINSDYNNAKLLDEGSINIPAAGASEIFTYVPHSANAIPQAMAWVEYQSWNGSSVVNALHPVGSTNIWSEGIVVVAGDISLAFVSHPYTGAHKAYYRIYLDV